MQSAAILLLSVFAAVSYGIAHDQITARICVEYFTIGHPPIFPTHDPTLLGLGWGIIATWWVGLILGIGLALAARAGSRPPRPLKTLLRPIVVLLAITGIAAASFGITGYLLANAGAIELVEPLASRIPAQKHPYFLADLWAHTASYAIGGLGGLATCVKVWRSRRR